MKINTVLFDLDGTLIDSLPLIRRTYQRVFNELNIPWVNEVMNSVGLPLVQIAKEYAGEERHKEFFKLYQQYYAIEHDVMTQVFPGTVEMLSTLKAQGYRLGLVTSKSRSVAIRSAQYVGIDNFMEVVVGAEDVTRHKPQPEPLLKALDLMNLPADTAAYVGDSPFDIMAAKGAGVMAVGVTWGMSDRLQIMHHEPNVILEEWDDLIKLLGLK
ncbi:HAD family hydrolase [Desulforamulus aquiferis]|uniref:HAD-IA family hydrolase n=1 Tax=Desulforamulus aquiferis TaxID=1397668 RepID=A0AAW7ZF28_9FIRM|nr:HAD-IA family hydrolase [Desulforamulus aquiferis]MDO7788327.1 HAD-IA family hydrolase [Desulforamulus aquiferis]RYD02789.1 hypothetical protein N752_23110 [Desulforamulus aquiferis]